MQEYRNVSGTCDSLAFCPRNDFTGAWSDCFRFVYNFLRFWYQNKAHIFLITGEMYNLEDINENVTSYGYHNYANIVKYRQLQSIRLLVSSC